MTCVYWEPKSRMTICSFIENEGEVFYGNIRFWREKNQGCQWTVVSCQWSVVSCGIQERAGLSPVRGDRGVRVERSSLSSLRGLRPTRSRVPRLTPWAAFHRHSAAGGDTLRSLLRYHFHFTFGCVVNDLHPVGRFGDFGEIFLRDQLVEVFGITALGHVKLLDGLVQRHGVNGLLRAFLGFCEGAEIIRGRCDRIAAGIILVRGRRGGFRLFFTAARESQADQQQKQRGLFHRLNLPELWRNPSAKQKSRTRRTGPARRTSIEYRPGARFILPARSCWWTEVCWSPAVKTCPHCRCRQRKTSR